MARSRSFLSFASALAVAAVIAVVHYADTFAERYRSGFVHRFVSRVADFAFDLVKLARDNFGKLFADTSRYASMLARYAAYVATRIASATGLSKRPMISPSWRMCGSV